MFFLLRKKRKKTSKAEKWQEKRAGLHWKKKYNFETKDKNPRIESWGNIKELSVKDNG
jgi:hypothetical protein